MNGGGAVLELRAREGRAVLVRRGVRRPCDPGPAEDVALPEQLAPALHEWAGVVDAVRRGGDPYGPWGDVVTERGRRLAGRLARCTGAPVHYVDPVSGLPEVLAPAGTREATPWATGLPVSVVTALVMVVALGALSQGLGASGAWVVVLGNAVVAAGLAPSLWLGRTTPVWRWIAYGAAAGMLLTWLGLLISQVGPG